MTPLEARGWIETAADILRPGRVHGSANGQARLLLALIVNPQGLRLDQAQFACGTAEQSSTLNSTKVQASGLRHALKDLGLGRLSFAQPNYVLTETTPGCIDRAVREMA